MSETSWSSDSRLLYQGLSWFVRLRLIAGLTIEVGAVGHALAEHWTGRHLAIAILGITVFAYGLFFWIALPLADGTERRSRRLLTLAWLQILLDLAALTFLTVWTGGVNSPVLWLFIPHMVFVSLLLPHTAAFGGAGAAIVLFAGALAATDQWPATPSEGVLTVTWIGVLILTVYLSNHITSSLRERQREIRRQNRQTQAIVDTAADGIITMDRRGRILSVNPAAERIFGYEPGELPGQDVKILMPEPYKGEHDQYVDNYLQTGEAKIIGIGREVIGLRKDGSTFPLDLAVSEVKLDDRHLFTGILRDVTERKEHEAALRRLNQQLKDQHKAMIQQEKMAAMGQMAAGVAHEISNPLASMDSLLQLLERKPERMGPDSVQTLREQVERIRNIVKQMTEFAHPNETKWEMVALNDLVDGTLKMVRYDHRIREVTVTCDLCQQNTNIRAMPQAVQQVLLNLVFNALDALEGVSEPQLTIRTQRNQQWCVVEVTDNGHGIPPEHIDRVFEAFFTTKPVGRGTGLGLSISYSLIQRHGGHCEVYSRPGEQTTFYLYLPAAEDPSCPRERPAEDIPDSENAAT